MQERIAIIDLGTNTFHLLIAQQEIKGFSFIYRERLAVRLGQKGINQGVIQEDAIDRAVRALSSFKTTLDQYDASRIVAFGTSALRNASNALEVIRIFKENTGIDVEIISGEREAELIFLGVQSGLQLGEEHSLVMDIGGGSVEFIIGNNREIVWKQSFEIGGQRLLELFHKTDPIALSEINDLKNHFNENLKPLFHALGKWNPTALVGSSGTFDTLSDIYSIKHNLAKDDLAIATPLTIEGFYEVYKELQTKNREERMKIPGMIEMRVDMIVVASCLIDFILEKHAFEKIRVSTYALKEGILASLKPVPTLVK